MGTTSINKQERVCRADFKGMHTNHSWKLNETYIKINGEKMCLYRAIDSEGHIIMF